MEPVLPALYPYADRQHILFPANATPPIVASRWTLILHTMDGYLDGSEAQWRTNGPTGVRSHIGIGGPWDESGQDGLTVQWVNLKTQAYAAWDANEFGLMVETSDGARANPTPAWSPKQLATLNRLAFWFALQCGQRSLQICTDVGGQYGTIGWHSLFDAWNQRHHNCPGPARVHQIRSVIIPSVNAVLAAWWATHSSPGGVPMTDNVFDTQIPYPAYDWAQNLPHAHDSYSAAEYIAGTSAGVARLQASLDALAGRVHDLDAKVSRVESKLAEIQ